jgi:hypothetical protein
MKNMLTYFEEEYGTYDMAEDKEKWNDSFGYFRMGWGDCIAWMNSMEQDDVPILHGEKEE